MVHDVLDLLSAPVVERTRLFQSSHRVFPSSVLVVAVFFRCPSLLFRVSHPLFNKQ